MSAPVEFCEVCGDYFCKTCNPCVHMTEPATEHSNHDAGEPYADPDGAVCLCRYLGNNLWSCGHIDNDQLSETPCN